MYIPHCVQTHTHTYTPPMQMETELYPVTQLEILFSVNNEYSM